MQKLTLEKYQEIREAALDEIVKLAQLQDNTSVLSYASPQDQSHLIGQLTHLKGKDFLESRKIYYREIFDYVFMQDGNLIQPNPSKKKKLFLLASTYTEAAPTLYKKLLADDKSLPKALRQSFKKVNNGHAILIHHDSIAEKLPEYQTAMKERHLYSFGPVYGEVKAISQAILSVARKYGYNIIDRTSTHSREKNDTEINALKNINPYNSDAFKYELISVGLGGKVDDFTNQPLKCHKHSSFSYVHNLVQLGLKRLSHPNAFPRVMKESNSSILLWDNGRKERPQYRYSIVATTKNGQFTFPRRDLWKEFQDFQNITNLANDYPVFHSTTYGSYLHNTPSDTKWTKKEENRKNKKEEQHLKDSENASVR